MKVAVPHSHHIELESHQIEFLLLSIALNWIIRSDTTKVKTEYHRTNFLWWIPTERPPFELD